jgi:hypothetical protein
MENLYVEQMNRMQVIDELRSHAHPSWFHSLLSWNTPRLKALLVYYREDAKEETRERKEVVSPLSIIFARIEKIN